MDAPADGQVEVLFGVKLEDELYDARPGAIEFRGGWLVTVQIGSRVTAASNDGLTIGFTLITEQYGVPDAAGHVRARAVERVYDRGVLDHRTDLGTVLVKIG